MWTLILSLLICSHGNPDFLSDDLSRLYPELTQVNNYPVIGILSLPIKPYESFNVNGTTYMASSYVKFLEMAGARVVPIKIDHSLAEFDYLFSRLNGILFTGGTANFWTSWEGTPILTPEYAAKGCYLYNLVKQANDNGNFFPLWGTCMGFELLHICENNQFATLGNFTGKPPYTRTHNFTQAASTSKIFNALGTNFGQKVMNIMATKNVSLLNHNHGISPNTYNLFPNLNQMFTILSTMVDRVGNVFIGMVESKKYPIFGTQFHPEKNIYEWNESVFPHTYDAVLMTTYFANFFVGQARLNNNNFTIQELTPQLIYNYPPIYLDSYFETISAFN